MLRPVELNTTGYPRPCQAHKSGLDHMVVIDEMTLADFVLGHLDATSEFRKDHHFYIFVLNKYGIPFVVGLFIGY